MELILLMQTQADAVSGRQYFQHNGWWLSWKLLQSFRVEANQTLLEIDFVLRPEVPWGTLLKTIDGGNTWASVNIPFAGTLYDVFFLNKTMDGLSLMMEWDVFGWRLDLGTI